jgi:hypothetical protein
VKFNVPNLFYFPMGKVTHIGRTQIAGCTTECGVVLRVGDGYTRLPVWANLCEHCVREIESLNYQPGLRA